MMVPMIQNYVHKNSQTNTDTENSVQPKEIRARRTEVGEVLPSFTEVKVQPSQNTQVNCLHSKLGTTTEVLTSKYTLR